MGVAYSSGLSKNGSWAEPDAVVPVVKVWILRDVKYRGRNLTIPNSILRPTELRSLDIILLHSWAMAIGRSYKTF